jgi:hypothetical protein
MRLPYRSARKRGKTQTPRLEGKILFTYLKQIIKKDENRPSRAYVEKWHYAAPLRMQ